MRLCLCLLALLAVATSAPAAVMTQAGVVQGVPSTVSGVTVFEGVPFAAPPVGALRWTEPQAVSPWRGVRKADHYAPACMQTGVSMPGETPPKTNEDCLYLNIWTPTRIGTARVPVMVWIHGGGYSNGSASTPLYRGDHLAKKGIVVVTVAYRLGPFGFLALPELTAASAHHSSGNFGIEDQIAALRWVKANIAAFGGDPDRVTIAGQSAGAASVSLLMASPLAKGLFIRAIAESGGVFEPIRLAPDYRLINAEKEGLAYEASLGAKSLADLRALPAAALLGGKAGAISHPVIDPYVLPASPYDVFARHAQNGAAILVGSNADEARSLIPDLSSVTAANFEAGIAKSWGPLPPPLLAAYPHADDAQARRARLDFERDLRFGWDDWAWARLQAASDRAVYYYYFDHAPPFPPDTVYAGWGPSHFSELWYVFDHLDQEPRWPWTSADRRVARDMSDYWVNFVKTGNPNGPSLPDWPRFDRGGDALHIDDAPHAGVVANLRTLNEFDAVYSQVRGAPFGQPGKP